MRTPLWIALLFSLLPLPSLLVGQPTGAVRHFSHEDKLAQSRIIDIQQDERGFIWLATFNGLIRYDGSTFRNFKVGRSDSIQLKSNRVYNFQLDHYQRIWIQSENNEVYFFDRRNLDFHHPLAADAEEYKDVRLRDFKVLPSGQIWLIPEKEGFLLSMDKDQQLTKHDLGDLPISSDDVRDIYGDQEGKSWLLTTKGICRINAHGIVPNDYFFGRKDATSPLPVFTTVMETDGEVWFGGKGGELLRFGKKSHTYLSPQLPITDSIIGLEKVRDEIIIVTEKDGFYTYDIASGEFVAYGQKTLKGFPNGGIYYLGLSQANALWFGNEGGGVYRFDVESRQLTELRSAEEGEIGQAGGNKPLFFNAPDGREWLQSKRGPLSYFDVATGELIPLSHCVEGKPVQLADVVHTAMFDDLGNLWFCSLQQGLDLLVFNDNFSTLDLNPTGNASKHNVRGIMEDKKGRIWLASRNNKITLLDDQKKVIGQLGADGRMGDSSADWGADIYHIMQDQQGRIWVGTRGNGLFVLTERGNLTFEIQHFVSDPRDSSSISSDHIYDIFQSSSGTIYLATWGGGINVVQPSGSGLEFISSRNRLVHYPIKTADRVRVIVEDQHQRIYFVTPYDLFSFSEQEETWERVAFDMYPTVAGNDIIDLTVTQDNQLVLATNGKGVLLVTVTDNGQAKVEIPLEKRMDFPLEGVVSLQQDREGRIWLMGENKIVRYDPSNHSTESFPELKAIMDNEIFSEATKYLLESGEIMVGYSAGAILFDPAKITPLAFRPHLSVSGFSVYNRDLHEIDPTASTNPDLLEKVTLHHDQNFFRIHLSALDYISSKNIMYRYKMVGVEDQWNYFQGSQSINYTNLEAGEYELLLESTNSHNLWTGNQRAISIHILPSIWKTKWAYFGYSLMAFFLFLIVRRIVLTIIKLRNDVSMEKQMAELKLKFFTDISHEIRTPLTMITAPVEKMISDEETPSSVKKQLQLIEKNSNKLLNLVNQILDLRRIQNRKLKVEEIDLEDIASSMCDSFRSVAEQRKIQLELTVNAQDTTIYADAEGVDKILVNLMSNAFKYCREHDRVHLALEDSETEVVLKISDTGPGIKSEIQKRLFSRFSNYNINPSNPSTGIGLNIVKDLMDKHGAAISVKSEPDQGTSFQLRFLKGYRHFDEEVEIEFGKKSRASSENLVSENHDLPDQGKGTPRAKKVGVVVEDDKELREFLISILEKEYTICEAEDGEKGLEMISKTQPDFVISDIMMPKMDGISLLKEIRRNHDTSHLPVILLTAKTSVDSQLEGITYGADDYMTKPFNVSLIRAKVSNLLAQRERLQQIYASGRLDEIKEPLHISNKDHEFMLRVIALVDENMMEPDFSVEELGKAMNMSRASFFNKLKGISGVSPVKFIRDLRLEKAAGLLKSEDYLIKEVVFQVGFNDLKYFGKCFKEKFGCSPKEYKESKGR